MIILHHVKRKTNQTFLTFVKFRVFFKYTRKKVIIMTILGIITEYNPFHNGHLYHLKEAKEISGAEAAVCLMNGNFVQRGRPALVDKWVRTKMAIENGVDLIIELPLIYGIRSAEYFAQGSIQTLNATGIIDKLVFGSEAGKIEPLKIIARILLDEPSFFKKCLKDYLSDGLSFPAARELALLDYLDRYENTSTLKEVASVFQEPNNILGIEYIKAIYSTKSDIIPLTIKRTGSNYHEKELLGDVASATAIRKKIYQEDFNMVKKAVPASCWKILENTFKQGKGPVDKNNLGIMILNKLRQLSFDELKDFAEIENGLGNRIIEAAHNSGNLNQLIDNIKTRAFTWTRIQRNLLHILFNIKEKDFQSLDYHGPKYLRILGFNKKGEELLARIKANSPLPMITQPADYLNEVNIDSNEPLIKSLSHDIQATDIYSLLFPEPRKRRGHLDFTTPIIRY